APRAGRAPRRTAAPRALAAARWPDRDPVLALRLWWCLIGTVMVCCLCALVLCAAAAFPTVHAQLFAPAPESVLLAYAAGPSAPWATALAALLAAGGLWTALVVLRELLRDRSARRAHRRALHLRAPQLPDGLAGGTTASGSAPGEAPGALLVLEDSYPDAWWLPGRDARLVVTTGALRLLRPEELDAVLAHERGHARARHHALLRLATALGDGFPGVPVFADLRAQTHRLVELCADDEASHRCGRLTAAVALIRLNEHRGVLSCSARRGAR
ncbi:M56 family metallopeptidase, partial [Streptomyces lonarensis]|uniref:M56 family metallopeptidase n=1 Tax=Streptomyces lonarensis TaxID=700599 RepID=UPI0030C70202